MKKHDIIKELVSIEKLLLQMKELNVNSRVDDLIVESVGKIVTLGQRLYPDLVKLRR
jgi:hypothetical protein